MWSVWPGYVCFPISLAWSCQDFSGQVLFGLGLSGFREYFDHLLSQQLSYNSHITSLNNSHTTLIEPHTTLTKPHTTLINFHTQQNIAPLLTLIQAQNSL